MLMVPEFPHPMDHFFSPPLGSFFPRNWFQEVHHLLVALILGEVISSFAWGFDIKAAQKVGNNGPSKGLWENDDWLYELNIWGALFWKKNVDVDRTLWWNTWELHGKCVGLFAKHLKAPVWKSTLLRVQEKFLDFTSFYGPKIETCIWPKPFPDCIF